MEHATEGNGETGDGRDGKEENSDTNIKEMEWRVENKREGNKERIREGNGMEKRKEKKERGKERIREGMEWKERKGEREWSGQERGRHSHASCIVYR